MSFLALKLDVVYLQNNPLAIIMGVEQYKAALATLESDDDDDERNFGAKNDDDDEVPRSNHSKKAKYRRIHYGRQCITQCYWWNMFICPKMIVECESDPDGRQAKLFRRMFRIPCRIFERTLLPLTID